MDSIAKSFEKSGIWPCNFERLDKNKMKPSEVYKRREEDDVDKDDNFVIGVDEEVRDIDGGADLEVESVGIGHQADGGSVSVVDKDTGVGRSGEGCGIDVGAFVHGSADGEQDGAGTNRKGECSVNGSLDGVKSVVCSSESGLVEHGNEDLDIDMAICNGIDDCTSKSGNFGCGRGLGGKRKRTDDVGSVASEKRCRVDFEQRDNPVMGSLQLLEGKLSEEQQKRYEKRYEEGYDLKEDGLYLAWASLKRATECSVERGHHSSVEPTSKSVPSASTPTSKKNKRSLTLSSPMSSRSASPKTPNSSFEDVLVLPVVERPKKKRQTFKQKIPNNLSAQEAIDLMIKRDEEKKKELEEKQKRKEERQKKAEARKLSLKKKIEKWEKRMLENQQGKSGKK